MCNIRCIGICSDIASGDPACPCSAPCHVLVLACVPARKAGLWGKLVRMGCRGSQLKEKAIPSVVAMIWANHSFNYTPDQSLLIPGLSRLATIKTWCMVVSGGSCGTAAVLWRVLAGRHQGDKSCLGCEAQASRAIGMESDKFYNCKQIIIAVHPAPANKASRGS